MLSWLKNNRLLIALIASLFCTKTYSQEPDVLIHAGQFEEAEAILLEQPESNIKYKLLGDIYFEKGFLEKALLHWKKSNDLRIKKYGIDDYHIAWNYALLSKYYREKINPTLSIAYADSCMSKTKTLNKSQKLEIEVWKLWNIMGQSYKLKRGNAEFKSHAAIYEDVRSLYRKSADFLKANVDQPGIHLAYTYHLIGNTHNDQMTSFNKLNLLEEALKHYHLANKFYDKAIAVTHSIYGEKHSQIALSFLTKGLLNGYVNKDVIPDAENLTIIEFEKSLKAYGYEYGSQKNTSARSLIHKKDFLMAAQHLSRKYLQTFKNGEEKEKDEILNKLDRLTDYSVKVWESYYAQSMKKNSNLNLAIYRLLPFTNKISVDVLKARFGEKYIPEDLFKDIQKYKAFDVVNSLKLANKVVSVSDIRESLKANQVFIDFIILTDIDVILATKITSDTVEVNELSKIDNEILQSFIKAIDQFDYNRYHTSARKIYTELIAPLRLLEGDQIILCLDGILNNLPFDALLTSDKGVDLKDYRELDYLIAHHSVRTVLAPQLLINHKKDLDFTISAFYPTFSNNESILPFNEELVSKLDSDYSAQIYTKNEAVKSNFLKSSSNILHLSSHAHIEPGNYENATIVLSDTALRHEDLKNIQNPPGLLVMNTCNSSLGKTYQGEGVDGFTRYARLSGVQSVLTNLWEVDDRASSIVLEKFYSNLADGNSTSTALQSAKVDYITSAKNSELAEPYYWSGHQVFGENKIFNVTKRQDTADSTLLWFATLSLVAFGLILFIFRQKIF